MNSYDGLSPVVIGGVGGSGTRLIVDFLQMLGYYMGEDINNSNDNLWFTLLFKRLDILEEDDKTFSSLVDIFMSRMLSQVDYTPSQVCLVRKLAAHDRLLHRKGWLSNRVDSLLSSSTRKVDQNKIGWKEPNTHVVVNRLKSSIPNLKYVHVMRNGLDMAYSNNQNQLKLWGEAYLGRKVEISPFDSLKYWVKVHERIVTMNNDNLLLLNFDDLCRSPATALRKLLVFIGLEPSCSLIEMLSSLVVIPSTIGRYQKLGTSVFDIEDVQFVERLGFDVHSL